VNTDDATPQDERLSDLLAACDEALAAGNPPGDAAYEGLTPEGRTHLEHGLAGMRLLRQVLSRPRVPATSSDGVPSGLGRFQVRRELGRGGFGIVFLAFDPQLRREVALKVPRAEALLDGELRLRFVREAQAAAGLDHPNVVAVHEAGMAGSVCYIASAYCPGPTLAQWLRRRDEAVPARQAALLVIALAEAVGHAHGRGVVHRDLKPSNVLLAPRTDATPAEPEAGKRGLEFTPKVTDFGLATFLAAASQEAGTSLSKDLHTQTGAVVGTPCYMAPEQAAGRPAEVSPAVDVYALGAILYELLTGRPPFRGESVLETLEQVRSAEPLPPRRLRPALPRDLETVCLKCLQKQAARRYASAGELADDLSRFSQGKPVRARRPGLLERVTKWARRQPALAALVAAAVGVTAAAFGAAAWHLHQMGEAHDATAQALIKAHNNLYYNRVALADREWLANNIPRAESLLDQCPGELRRWEWRYLARLCRGGPDYVGRHKAEARAVAFSPDGRRLASASWDGTVKVWDTAGRGEILVLRGHPGSHAVDVAFSPDGTRLASVGFDSTVQIWDAATGRELRALRPPPPFASHLVYGVAFGPDSRRLAAACGEPFDWGRLGEVVVWDADTGEALFTLSEGGHTRPVLGIAFSPDGQRLASAGMDATVKVWEARPGQKPLTLSGHTSWVYGVAFSRDGTRLASASADGTARVWDVAGGRQLQALTGHTHRVYGVAFSPDGRRLASAGKDRAVKIWDVATGRELLTLRGQRDQVRGVAFSPDGFRVASACYDGTVALWDPAASGEATTLFSCTDEANAVAFSPGGDRLASAWVDGGVRLWDAGAGRALVLRAHAGSARAVAFHPGGGWLASAGDDGAVKDWAAHDGGAVRNFRGQGSPVFCLAFSPDGRLLATGGGDSVDVGHRGDIEIWDATSGRLALRLPGQAAPVFGLAFSPDGRVLASAGGDRTVRLWGVTTGKEVRAPLEHGAAVRTVTFCPDGRRLVAAGWDRAVRVWDWAAGRELLRLGGQRNEILTVAVSPDEPRLVSAGEDGAVTVWDMETGEEILLLRGHTKPVYAVAFSPDGRRIASAGDDGTVKAWDATPPGERAWRYPRSAIERPIVPLPRARVAP
jgi:WD40 repeat protein